ncbi:MAG: hypothetical protein HY074_05105 [Deltaproteobacteria bacterium]|nr:hypothetical protein [Deltaproteobacteria bacterium]
MRASAVAMMIAGFAGAFSGCAKQQFVKEQFTASASAVGFRYLPAKVDILMVPDNTGSINSVFSTVQSQLSGFVSGLQGQYWDYHVGRSPVYYPANTPRSVGNPVLVNGDYNTNVLPDGTTVAASGIVPSDRATTNLNNFPILQSVFQTGNGDNTFSNTYSALANAQNDTYTNFLRQDALLAVIVMTNGYDITVSDQYGNISGAGSSNLQMYANQLIGLKGTAKLVRFYAVASYGVTTNDPYCGTSYSGNSYFGINQYILGLPKFDGLGNPISNICNSAAMANVLSDIQTNLNIVKQSYIYSNLVLTDQPVVSSIQLTKNGAAVPQDDTNGWSYKGLETVYTVTGIQDQSTGVITQLSPGLNQRTGYVIQLNGAAKMVGSDTPNLVYEKQ